jgi:hypothetical protein
VARIYGAFLLYRRIEGIRAEMALLGHGGTVHIKFLIAFVAAIPVLCQAGTVSLGGSFLGSFEADNQEEFFSLVASSPTILNAETWSYGGGVNAAGQTIPSGGFAPAISIFNSLGQLIALDITGGSAPNGCGGRNIDPSTQSCFDASIQSFQLSAGNYTLVLTEQGNDPVGSLTDGFSEDALNGNDPSFTGTNAGMPGATFLDPGNFSQRTNQWAVDIGGSGITVSETPEPSAALMLGTGFLLMVVARKNHFKRKRKSQ